MTWPHDRENDRGGSRVEPDEQVGSDGECLLRCLKAASVWLDRHVSQINALNVFPVPDGDTGTNMSLTMRAALDEAGQKSYSSVCELAHIVAHGALMGARGNSGVILSQIFRGFSRHLDEKSGLTPRDLADALGEGADTAYKGVVKPVEGTILTVAREAAEAASRAADSGAGIVGVLEAAVMEAEASLARTPDLLPVLAEAGVVDAGGQGFLVLLAGALCSLRGEDVEAVEAIETIGVGHAHAPEGDYNYDTQFVILGNDLDLESIRQNITRMGDSVLVVGDSEVVKVHVHSDCPGRVLDYGIRCGQVNSVIIENMQLQYEEFRGESAKESEEKRQRSGLASSGVLLYNSDQPLSDVGVVAIVSGQGLQRVFESLGVSAIVSGGQTMNPSTQHLLTAIANVSQDELIILPNNSNIILAAQQAKELSDKKVRVVPTRTVPQGIAALLAFNYQGDVDMNYELMLDASREVQTAEITRAVRTAQVNGLSIAEGQMIGLLNGELTAVGEESCPLIDDLFGRVGVADYEIVTIYYGEDVSPENAQELADHIRDRYPDLEVEVLDGGQAHYHYIISAE